MYGKGSNPKKNLPAGSKSLVYYTVNTVNGSRLIIMDEGEIKSQTTVPTIFGVKNNLQLDELTHTG